LIEKFILENIPHIKEAEDISQSFDTYWNEEQQKAFSQMVQEENLSAKKRNSLLRIIYLRKESLFAMKF
jgi:type I restriction enzyme R subunit